MKRILQLNSDIMASIEKHVEYSAKQIIHEYLYVRVNNIHIIIYKTKLLLKIL